MGRGAECARIDQVLADARAGRSAALVLRGEPGIGKTSLLAYAERGAAGMRVLRALGVEAESELPFAGLHELVRPLLHYLPELDTMQADAMKGVFAAEPPSGTSRFAVYAGTLALLATAAEDRPLVCLVDDAHWLDRPTAEALLFSARRFLAESVAIFFAARDEKGQRFESPGIPELET